MGRATLGIPLRGTTYQGTTSRPRKSNLKFSHHPYLTEERQTFSPPSPLEGGHYFRD